MANIYIFKPTTVILFVLFHLTLAAPQLLHAAARNRAQEFAVSEPTTTVILYDGSGLMSFSTGFTLFGFPLFSWQESYNGDVTTLASTSTNSIQVGYNSRSNVMPALDRDLGYRLTFISQLNSETHTSLDRAGFSVIILANDMKGVELGFWPNEIWGQNDGTDGTTLFTHGEGAVFETTAVTTYTLEFIGDTYRLSANNAPMLNGPVRDYSAFSGTINPYINQNYIFMGDDTKSAQASVSIANVAITTNICAEHDSHAPTLMAELDSDTVDLSWQDTPQNFSYTAVRSALPYTAVADATTLASTADMSISDSDILTNINPVFYQVQEDYCATAVSNEVGVFRFAMQAGN